MNIYKHKKDGKLYTISEDVRGNGAVRWVAERYPKAPYMNVRICFNSRKEFENYIVVGQR
jgi:hypothetical protein